MSVGDTVASLVFLLVALLQLKGIGGRGARRLPGVTFLFFAATLTLHSKGVYLGFDRVFGVPNLADLFVHLLGLTGIATLTMVLLQIVDRGRHSLVEATVATAAGLAAAALFAASDTPVETANFTATYRDQWTIRIYWLIPVIYGVVCLTRLLIIVGGARRQIARTDVRVGLQVAAYGGFVFGWGYVSLKVIELLAGTGGAPRAVVVGDDLCLAIGMLCLALGFGAPLIVRLLAQARRQAWTRWTLQRLRPLRAQLDKAGLLSRDLPGLSSNGSLVRDVLCRDSHARLQRRVVEVRDGLLLLHGRMNDTASSGPVYDLSLSDLGLLHEWVHGVRPRSLDVEAEARMLASLRFDTAPRMTSSRKVLA